MLLVISLPLLSVITTPLLVALQTRLPEFTYGIAEILALATIFPYGLL